MPKGLDPDQARHFVWPDLGPNCKGYEQTTYSNRQELNTVNLEIFARILFLRIALKVIFAMVKICEFDMIYLHQ